MRKSVVLLAWTLLLTGCGTHDRTEELQQQKLTLELTKAQNEQLAALTKAQDERLAALKQKEKDSHALEKKNQETLQEIGQQKKLLEELRERISRDEAVAKEKVRPEDTKREIDAAVGGARAFLRAGEYDNAISCLTKAMDRIGLQHDLLVARSRVLLAQVATTAVPPEKREPYYDSAIADLTEAIRLDTSKAKTFHLRGTVYAEAGKPARAIEDLDNAMKLDPKLAPICYLQKGQQYMQQKDYPKAITELTESVRLDPLNEEAFYCRGLSYFALADEEIGGVQAYQGALNNCLKWEWDSGSRTQRGKGNALYWTSQNCRKAAADFQKVIRLCPGHVGATPAVNTLALVQKAFEEDQKQKESVAEANAAVEKAAAERQAAVEKAAAEKQAAEEMSIAEMQKAGPVAYYKRGYGYLMQGERDKAIADFTEAIRLNPKYALAYARRSDAYSINGEWDKAIVDLTEAIRLNPTVGSFYRGRGYAYKQKGEVNKADEDFAKATALGYKP